MYKSLKQVAMALYRKMRRYPVEYSKKGIGKSITLCQLFTSSRVTVIHMERLSLIPSIEKMIRPEPQELLLRHGVSDCCELCVSFLLMTWKCRHHLQ